MAKVYVEFEEPESCYDCPLFYATEGAYCDRCQLTNEEAEKINIWKEKLENCPLKKVETFEDWLSPEIHAEIMNGYSSAEDKMKLAKKIYERSK